MPLDPSECVTAAEIREMDRVAIETYGVPGVVLMENAGAGAAAVAKACLPEGARRVAVLAGRGNNGGDGFVVARHLLNAGHAVHVVFAGDLDAVSPAGDAGINLFVLLKSGQHVLEVRTPGDADALAPLLEAQDLLVDGLLGTGSRGAPREPLAALIRAAHRASVPLLALDLPSGLDADTGEAPGECVRAAHTVTFVRPKKGFVRGAGPSVCGTVHVVDIGMPARIVDEVLTRMRNPE